MHTYDCDYMACIQFCRVLAWIIGSHGVKGMVPHVVLLVRIELVLLTDIVVVSGVFQIVGYSPIFT